MQGLGHGLLRPGDMPGFYVDPAPAYAPAYGYGYTYAPRPSVRHHAGGPGKRQIDSFRDSYR